MKGRPRKPAAMKLLHGTYRADRENPNQPKPDPLKKAPIPEWLDQYGRECWEAHIPQLLKNRLLTPLGTYLFEAICERWSTYRRATDELKTGLTHETDSNGVCSRPEIAIAKAAFNDFRQGLQEFGMTPATCAKVTAGPDDKDDDDPAARYFAQKPSAKRFLR